MVRGIVRRVRDVAGREQPTAYDPRDEDSLHAAALRLLRAALDDPTASFRDGQWEAIRDLVMHRNRLLLVQRTGWGKSIVYFIATALLRQQGAGPTLLISPLLSLMRNQILAARRIGIRAVTLNSSNTDEWPQVERLLFEDEVEVLLISPERLSNDSFRQDVLAHITGRTGLFVVDEAHCISDWGHDFRPDYRRIVRVLRLLPSNVPVLATTATANDRVVTDIQDQLGEQLRTIRGPLVRRSLQLQTIRLLAAAPRLAWLAEHVPNLPGSGIIYTLTRHDAEEVAAWLRAVGIPAEAYHSELHPLVREQLEQQLLDNGLKVLVATVALGMGFDKPDLGFVIHYQRPGSVIHYYQQIGRAGRALKDALAVLLYSPEDDEIVNYFIQTAFPSEEDVYGALGALNQARDGLTQQEIQRHANLADQMLERTLRYLAAEEPSPVEQIGDRWFATPINYRFDTARVERVTKIRRLEQQRMKEYVQNERCLMQFLLSELNDPYAEPCGRCTVCLDHPIVPVTFSQDLARRAGDFLKQRPVVIEPKETWPYGNQNRGLDIPEHQRLQPGYALCKWGDSGWSGLVRRGKWRNHFDDQLANALADLIRYRWRPEPPPKWVTCVPSLRHPNLVPELARRFAANLGLPFIPCIEKVRETRPQKEMQNSYQQVKNLENAFMIDRTRVLDQPVLLVDDIVDSGWTFAILAALLQDSGSGPVLPVALADSRSR